MTRGFSLSSGAILLLSCVYFFGGLSSLAALISAVAVHEAGHAAALLLCGGRIGGLRFDSSGLCMFGGCTGGIWQELAALAAGPAAGLAFALACAKAGAESANGLLLRAAGLSFVLTAYNLLPALPLDGGRILQELLKCTRLAAKADNIMYCAGLLTGAALSAAGIASLGSANGAALLTAGLWLLIAQTGIVKSMRLM